MPRRVSLPSADDLFRPTEEAPSEGRTPSARAVHAVPDQPGLRPVEAVARPRRPSGRVRHDEKMTVYVTADELLQIEHARLVLRSRHGLAVDRGRLIREAIALVLADLELNADASALVHRLTQE